MWLFKSLLLPMLACRSAGRTLAIITDNTFTYYWNSHYSHFKYWSMCGKWVFESSLSFSQQQSNWDTVPKNIWNVDSSGKRLEWIPCLFIFTAPWNTERRIQWHHLLPPGEFMRMDQTSQCDHRTTPDALNMAMQHGQRAKHHFHLNSLVLDLHHYDGGN